MKDKHNEILESNGQSIRVIDYNPTRIDLSNSFIVTGRDEVINFNKRIKKNHYVMKFDVIYSEGRGDILKEIKSVQCRIGGYSCQDKHGDRIKNNLNTGTPWNKDKPTGIEPWNKGLTKNEDGRLLKLSIDRCGEGNHMFGSISSDETKKKQSDSMKQLIENGDFTPNIHNSHTHWQIEYNGRRYRSSWEAFFHHFNQEYEYETLRIPYAIDDVDKIYIVDFVNHTKKHVVELKPKCRVNGKIEQSKETSLSIWCDNHGYTYDVLTEDYVSDNIHKLDDDVFDKETMRKLNETCKTNRNRQT